MTRVFITRRLPTVASECLSEHFDVTARDENSPCPPAKLAAAVTQYDGILSTVSEKFDASLLSSRTRLSALSNYASGLDNIDCVSAERLGIAVYNTPFAVVESTADLTLALLLALVRRIPSAMAFARSGGWTNWDPERGLGDELHGKTLGLLGFGRIGQAVARRALGFGLRVVYYDVAPCAAPSELAVPEAGPVTFNELLEAADYLSLHVPLTPATRGLINAATISRMRRRPVLLNMARGDVVVTRDILAALEAGMLRGAALDVISGEQLSPDHPLCRADNVIVVPHIGTATVECRRRMAEAAAVNLIRHFTRRP